MAISLFLPWLDPDLHLVPPASGYVHVWAWGENDINFITGVQTKKGRRADGSTYHVSRFLHYGRVQMSKVKKRVHAYPKGTRIWSVKLPF